MGKLEIEQAIRQGEQELAAKRKLDQEKAEALRLETEKWRQAEQVKADNWVEVELPKIIKQEEMPPDISATKPVPAIYARFHDDQACPPSYEELALSTPDEILKLLGEDLPPHELTFVAEAAGKLADAERAVAALLPLLEHASPVVREGTIYGLSSFMAHDAVRLHLQHLADNDPSPGVREAAREAIEP